MSRRTLSPSLPESLCEKTLFPVPISPTTENLMLSLLVSILIVSDKLPNYLQIRPNSLEGMVQIEVKSVSGIPKV